MTDADSQPTPAEQPPYGFLSLEQLQQITQGVDTLASLTSTTPFATYIGSGMDYIRQRAGEEESVSTHEEAAFFGAALGVAATRPLETMIPEEHLPRLAYELKQTGIRDKVMTIINAASLKIALHKGDQTVVAGIVDEIDGQVELEEGRGEDLTLFRTAIYALAFGATEDPKLKSNIYDKLMERATKR